MYRKLLILSLYRCYIRNIVCTCVVITVINSKKRYSYDKIEKKNLIFMFVEKKKKININLVNGTPICKI